MTKEVHTRSEEGFQATVSVREFTIEIDSSGESAPDTLEVLIGDYAACYVPALRVGAQQRDIDDLGEIDIDVTAELNEDDKLESVAFDITVDADVDDAAQAIIDRANALCKVHDALKPSLHADVSLSSR